MATDALTVVVHADNPVDCLTIPQLNQIWDRDAEVENWSEIEGLEVEFDERLDLFGPGTDSGTFDYFSDVVNGAYAVDVRWITAGLVILAAPVLFGGVRRVAQVAEIVLPLMAVVYALLALVRYTVSAYASA